MGGDEADVNMGGTPRTSQREQEQEQQPIMQEQNLQMVVTDEQMQETIEPVRQQITSELKIEARRMLE
jgi:hypothetical protein